MVQQRIDEILRLVEELSPEEHDVLEQEMRLRWLRRALDEGENDSAAGRVVSLDELEQRLDAKRRAMRIIMASATWGKRSIERQLLNSYGR